MLAGCLSFFLSLLTASFPAPGQCRSSRPQLPGGALAAGRWTLAGGRVSAPPERTEGSRFLLGSSAAGGHRGASRRRRAVSSRQWPSGAVINAPLWPFRVGARTEPAVSAGVAPCPMTTARRRRPGRGLGSAAIWRRWDRVMVPRGSEPRLSGRHVSVSTRNSGGVFTGFSDLVIG